MQSKHSERYKLWKGAAQLQQPTLFHLTSKAPVLDTLAYSAGHGQLVLTSHPFRQMKLTTTAVLAFAAASALANFVPYEETAVYARNLHERDGSVGSLESFDKRGGAFASSLFKSFAGAAGSMSGRVASNSAQYGISRGISSSSHSTHSTPKPTRHRRPHLRQLRRQRPPQPPPQPPSLEERTIQRGLSTPAARLEKLRRGKAKAPSLFKATSGVARRALFPVATSRSSFAPVRAIKNAFNRTSQVTAGVYRKSAPARKKGKGILIAFLDGVNEGIAKKKS